MLLSTGRIGLFSLYVLIMAFSVGDIGCNCIGHFSVCLLIMKLNFCITLRIFL
jgi:hypothetical protein